MTGTAHRYPGIRSFSSDPLDRALFQGRERETKSLLHLVLAERLVVLYARSGMGKSSLISAGVTHPLRDRGHCTVSVRLNDPDTHPLQALRDQFGPAVEAEGHEFIEGPGESLWAFFKNSEIWAEDDLVEPVLILDQFEELFTLHGDAHRREFISELAAVVRGIGPREETARFGASPPRVKVLLSLREDFLGHLEELAADLPAIFENRYRIGSLGKKQAREAIVRPAELPDERFASPPFAWSEDAVDRVLDFLASSGAGEERIEPFQLQLICQHVEQRMMRAPVGTTVQWSELGGATGLTAVMEGFYRRSLDELGGPLARRKVQRLCEDGLITEEGRRLSLEESDIASRFGLSPAVLGTMVDQRLLRREPRVGSNYYELSHDTMVEPILESRGRRRKHQARRRLLGAFAVAAVALIGLAGGLWLSFDRNLTSHLLSSAERNIEEMPDDALAYALTATKRSADYIPHRGTPTPVVHKTLAASVHASRVLNRLTLDTPPTRAGAAVSDCPDPKAGWQTPPAAAVASSPVDRLIAVGGTDRVWLLDYAGKAVGCTQEAHRCDGGEDCSIAAVGWSPRGHRFASVDSAGETRVWDVMGEGVAQALPGLGSSPPDAVALSPTAAFVSVGTRDGVVHQGSVSQEA
ncbi:MAG: hypothetical protein KDA24_29890, partial [Deltaproteobacteria bacterium]|nr:hypothetical protein [Deltaproteobacteria bacterium]